MTTTPGGQGLVGGQGQDTSLGLQPHSPPFLLCQDDPGRMHLPKFQASPRPCSQLPPSGFHPVKCTHMQLRTCQRRAIRHTCTTQLKQYT